MQRFTHTVLTLLVVAVSPPGLSKVRAQETQHPDADGLRAGAAVSNITPPLGASIVGGWKPLPANEVHDELHCRALVLDDSKRRIAIVLCDNVGIPREVLDDAKQRIDSRTGIPPSRVLAASTHTHSAASARGEHSLIPNDSLTDYQRFISQRIADCVHLAVQRLEPAEVGWGSVNDDTELFNRRWFVKEEAERRDPFGGVDQVRMNPSARSTLIRPAGPVDPEISILSVRSREGRPIAVLANYSLHYVGGIPARVISADYFGVFAKELADRLGVRDQYPPFVGILSNGTSGDVNNINFADRRPSSEPYQRIYEVGSKIAERVYRTLPSMVHRSDLTVDGVTSELELSVRKPDAELLAYMRGLPGQDSQEQRYHRHELTYRKRVEQLAQSPDTVAVPLQAIRIGQLGIAGIPFEVFTETGLALKQRSPLGDAFTIELAGGSYGYLPTPEQHKLGGYETWMGTSRFEVQASEKILERLLSMFTEFAQAK